MKKIEVVKQGNRVTNQLREDLVHLFSIINTTQKYKSIDSEKIKSEIEQRFKYCLYIVQYSNDFKMKFSFVYGVEFPLELRSESYEVLAYIVPDQPQTQYEPRSDIAIIKPQFRTYPEIVSLKKNNFIQSSIISNPLIRYYSSFYI